MRRAVAERVRLSCSLGVATCKVVAKVASDRDKPGGVTVVAAGAGGRLPGAAAAARAARRGAAHRGAPRPRRPGTIGDLAALATTRPCAGSCPGKFGEDLRRRARGIDPRPVAAVPPERISVSAETTFERDVAEPARLEAIGRELAESVADALRRRGRGGPHGDGEAALRRLPHDHPQPDRGRRASRTPRRSGRRPPRCSRGPCASAPGPCGCWASACPGLSAERQLTLF